MKAINVFAMLAGFSIAQLAAAWFIHIPNAREQGRRDGYAAAVDSVRQDEWRSQPIRTLMDSGVPFRIMVGDSGSVIYVSGRTR